MNLPLPPISGAVTAAIAAGRVAANAVQQLASNVADAVTDQSSGGISFGEVLQGDASAATTTPLNEATRLNAATELDELKSQFIESARKAIASLGISSEQTVSLSISRSGQIKAGSDNPSSIQDQAANIELSLATDPSLSDLASQLLSASGTSQISVELPATGNLTIPLSQANIAGRFGG